MAVTNACQSVALLCCGAIWTFLRGCCRNWLSTEFLGGKQCRVALQPVKNSARHRQYRERWGFQTPWSSASLPDAMVCSTVGMNASESLALGLRRTRPTAFKSRRAQVHEAN
jgi:hypothetical protein